MTLEGPCPTVAVVGCRYSASRFRHLNFQQTVLQKKKKQYALSIDNLVARFENRNRIIVRIR